MSNSLSTFTFALGAGPGPDVVNLRVIDRDGQPWFIAKDVCDVLGYAADVSATLTKHVDDEDRCPINLNSLSNRGSIRGNPRVSCINESGLYALILGSKLPDAQRFKKWVTQVVLPSIRKDGGYVMGEEKVVSGEMSEDEFLARAVQMADKKLARLKEENLKLTRKVAEMEPLSRAGTLMCDDEDNLYNFMRALQGVKLPSYLADLERLGYLYRPYGGAYKPYRGKNEIREGYVSGNRGLVVTSVGKLKLLHHYLNGDFTMNAGMRPCKSTARAIQDRL